MRLFVLERDRHRCRIGYAGCTQTATEADHIVKVEDGGAWLDPFNLRAACKHCNVVRENKQRGTRNDGMPRHLGPSRP